MAALVNGNRLENWSLFVDEMEGKYWVRLIGETDTPPPASEVGQYQRVTIARPLAYTVKMRLWSVHHLTERNIPVTPARYRIVLALTPRWWGEKQEDK